MLCFLDLTSSFGEMKISAQVTSASFPSRLGSIINQTRNE